MARILGRPPLQAGPFNNPDGSWNLVWVRWLDALYTLVNMLLDQGVLSLNDLVGALTILGGSDISVSTSGNDITISFVGTGGGGGTVTSVAASVPGFLTVTVTNPTTTPSVIITATVEAQNLFLASPNGAGGVMAPRAIVPADLPLGSSTAFGAVKVDGTTITAAAGVISAVGGGFSPFPPSLTVPASTNFTWLNQLTASVTDKSTRMILNAGGSSNANALISNTSLPSPPYTIDIGLIGTWNDVTGSVSLAGIVLKSAGGALRTYSMRANGVSFAYRSIQAWASITSPGAEVQTGSATEDIGNFNFLRITDDSTTRKYWWSHNGTDYTFGSSEATNTGITPATVGVIVFDTNTTVPLTAVFYHFLVSNSILPASS